MDVQVMGDTLQDPRTMVDDGQLIDTAKLAALRQELGSSFGRVLSYFREDGAKSIAAIEEAARARSAVALVRPAHTLKGDSLQFGAVALGRVAERIEMAARRAVEDRDFPTEMIAEVVKLRPLFDQIATALARETSAGATIRRAVGFGRKVQVDSRAG